MNVAAANTCMYREAAQAPEVVRAQLEANAAPIARLAQRLQAQPPRAVVTCARGSSDHAATFARYLIETRLGLLTSSAAPSVSSVYEARPDLAGTVMLAISQSGASPDLLATVSSARSAGALVVALVNAESSPLAQLADEVLPLHAGPERSVAATKSYIASLSAIVQLAAVWARDARLSAALQQAPELLARAWELDWSAGVTHLVPVNDMYVIGRGLGLAIAQEAALKLKETCALHAEAVSAAELRHGPMALVGAGFPLLVFSQNDESRAGVAALAAELASAGADVLLAGGDAPRTTVLPALAAHPVIEPLLFTQSFYRLANALSLARGGDPDRPPNLNKVTETI